MRQTKRTPIIYTIFILAILLGVGTFQIFEKPEVASTTLATQITATPPLAPADQNPVIENKIPPKETHIGGIEAFRFASPEVVGDENIINVEASDGPRFQELLSKAKAGDTFRLSDGEYQTGALQLNASGKSGHWIKIVAAEDSKPKINLKGEGDFHISGSYVFLEGLEIFNGVKANIRVASTTRTMTHVYVKKIKLHSLPSGSALKIQRNNANGVGVANVFVENSDLSQNNSSSIVDGVGANIVVIRNNFIHADSGSASAIVFHGGSSRILIENNFIKGAHGNPAIIMGGKTFLNFFDPQYPDQEGVDQIARNNIIVNFDEAAVSFQGVRNAKFLHNTLITSSPGPIFNFSEGNTNDGSKASKNQNILIENNLVVSKAAGTNYASNDSGVIPQLQFGKQMWIGSFTNPSNGRISIPQFPQTADVSLSSQKALTVLESLEWTDVMDIETARVRFSPRENSPILRSVASIGEVPADFLGHMRTETTSFGAVEN